MFVPDDVIAHVQRVSDEPDLSGTKYRLIGRVGRGGMGAVYAARDVELDRDVAIKVVAASRGASALGERLEREAKVLARLEHPGIVPVHDVGRLPDGTIFYVMKLVRGERLDAWAARAERNAVLRMFQRVCEAVAFAHAHGVLHRDLKPENVMIGEFGEALVMDFGLAKQIGGEAPTGVPVRAKHELLEDTLPATSDRTAAGTIMGTPAYMPPEQARGEIDVLDARSDVYSLGAMLYALLAKRPPFSGETGDEVLERVIQGEPTPLRTIVADLPKPLVSICDKAMSKDPADRYASALEVARDIERLLDLQPVTAHRESLVERALRFGARHRVILSLLAVYLTVRLVLAVVAR